MYVWVLLFFMRAATINSYQKMHFRACCPVNRLVDNIKLHSTTSTVSDLVSKDSIFMKLAIRHAQHAYREREVPIGAVLVDEDHNVIASARNSVEELHDATAHAEVLCMRKAASLQENWRLHRCTLYTTLEPCNTCFSAAQAFRIKRLVYGAKDLRLGACGSFQSQHAIKHPFHEIVVHGGVLEDESALLLKRFFKGVRDGEYRFGSFDLGRGEERA